MAKFNIADYFKKNVTLPKTVITVYTDGDAAWRYGEAKEALENIKRQQEQGVLIARTVGSIADVPDTDFEAQIEEAEEKVSALLAEIAASGVRVHLRALYPAEMKVASEKATREAKARFKDETPSEDDLALVEAKLTNAVFLATAVSKMEYPDGTEVEAPIKFQDFEAIEEYLNGSEYGKLITGLRELNMTQAMRDAQGDAGFPGGLPESPGEQ